MVNVLSMRLALISVWGLLATPLATAAPSNYFFSGTGTGTIGGKAFTNASYVIVLTGDTNTIDTSLIGLAEWRNAVTGTIKIGGRRAAITQPIAVAAFCMPALIGVEHVPGGGPFPAYIFSATPIPSQDCALQAAAPASGLTPHVSSFVNLQSTKGPITMTSSSPVTYEAKVCTRPGRGACKPHGAQSRHRRSAEPAD